MTAEARQGRPAGSGLLDLDGPAARRWQEGGRRLGRFLGLALLSLVAVGAAIGQLGEALGWLNGEMRVKLALLDQNPDTSIVFVGPSNVAYGVNPAVVDAALAAAGCEGRSLNLAVDGASMASIARAIDAVADRLPPGRLVVTYGAGFVRNAEAFDRGERQESGLAFLGVTLAGLESARRSPWELLPYLYQALQYDLGVHRLYGGLLEPIDSRWRENTRHRGYVPIEDLARKGALRRRDEFIAAGPRLSEPSQLEQVFLRLARRAPELATAALTLVGRIQDSGNRAVLLILPAQGGLGPLSARNAMALQPALPAIDLGVDLQVLPWPDPDYFFDFNHLTRLGAEVASREIGLRLCELMRGGV